MDTERMKVALVFITGQRAMIEVPKETLDEFMASTILPNKWIRIGETYISTAGISAVSIVSEDTRIEVPQASSLQLVRG
jgi:hypothetical protein